MKFYEELKQKLCNEYKYKIELHAHSSPASSCSQIPPETVVENYKKLGYDAVSITNHFFPTSIKHVSGKDSKEEQIEFYLNDYRTAKKMGDKLGINVILGAELRFENQNGNDYLIFGINENDLYEIFDFLDGTVEDFYKSFKNNHNFLLQAHPFRDGQELIDINCIDGIEAFNLHPNHNSRIAVAAKYAKDNGKLFTAGTDYHHEGHQGLANIRTKSLPNNSDELAALLKENDFILETTGTLILP